MDDYTLFTQHSFCVLIIGTLFGMLSVYVKTDLTVVKAHLKLYLNDLWERGTDGNKDYYWDKLQIFVSKVIFVI